MENGYCTEVATEDGCIDSKVLSCQTAVNKNYSMAYMSGLASFNFLHEQQGQETSSVTPYLVAGFVLAATATLVASLGEIKKIKNPEKKADRPYNIVAYTLGAGAVGSLLLHFLN